MTRRPRLRAWAPFGVWTLVVLALSSIPQSLLPALPSGHLLDKWVHAAEFAVLGLLAARGLRRDPGLAGRRGAFAVALVGLVVLGIIDELHQALIPGRHPEGLDAVADFSGAAAGLGLGATLWRGRTTDRGVEGGPTRPGRRAVPRTGGLRPIRRRRGWRCRCGTDRPSGRRWTTR